MLDGNLFEGREHVYLPHHKSQHVELSVLKSDLLNEWMNEYHYFHVILQFLFVFYFTNIKI